MRKMLLLVPLILAASCVAHADPLPCYATTEFQLLSGASCTIGTLTFSNFTYLFTETGGTPINDPSQLIIIPCPRDDETCGSILPGESGFVFNIPGGWDAQSGQTLDVRIGFTVACYGPCVGASLGYFSSELKSPASGSALETLSGGCGSLSLAVQSPVVNPANSSCTLPDLTTITVSDDISLDGGPIGGGDIYGPAVVDIFALGNGFSYIPAPEPSSLLLLGSGFMFLGICVLHRIHLKQ